MHHLPIRVMPNVTALLAFATLQLWSGVLAQQVSTLAHQSELAVATKQPGSSLDAKFANNAPSTCHTTSTRPHGSTMLRSSLAFVRVSKNHMSVEMSADHCSLLSLGSSIIISAQSYISFKEASRSLRFCSASMSSFVLSIFRRICTARHHEMRSGRQR